MGFDLFKYMRYLGGIHLVDSDDELTDTEGEGEESVLAGLAILGDTSLKLTGTASDDEDKHNQPGKYR